MSKANECVKVMIRCRPLNQKEINNGSQNIVSVKKQEGQISLNKEKDFKFDNVFDDTVSQAEIYEKSAFALVESVVQGYNGTIFAYGQTGCGKTHTMMGYAQNPDDKGIIPRTFDQILSIIQQTEGVKSLVRCSFIEIYNEEIHDLLSKDAKEKYDLKQGKEGSVYIKDLNMHVVKTVAEMNHWMEKGNGCRSVGATLMNKDSSRSHSIFTIYVEQSVTDEQGNERITLGKLNLVDLAGSERLSKTGAQGDRLKEATKINMSLSALGNVISALVDGKSKHIPYRESKLTRLLQDSLGGNTKTIMIANISPADYNYDETYGTLRYAARAKNIKNKPTVNEDPKDALLKEYAEEIKRLKAQLEGKGGAVPRQPSERKQNNESADRPQLKLTSSQQAIQNVNIEQQQKQVEIENELVKEKQERQRLEELIKGMNDNAIEGGGADEAQKQEYKEYKEKLEQQEKEHEQYIESRKQQEEELLAQECTFQNLQEEVEHLRKQAQQLRNKYTNEQEEVKELQREHQQANEDVNDLLRIQEKELKLLRQITKQVFKKEEIEQLKSLAQYDASKETYNVPPFIFRDKSLRFPKLPPNLTQENDDKPPKITPASRGKYSTQNRKEDKKSKLREDYQQEDDINFEDFQIPMKINKKVHLQPIRNSSNNMNMNSGNHQERNSHDMSLKNAKNTKLQPLQQLLRQNNPGANKTKQMDINFKATIHINNNGDIYY